MNFSNLLLLLKNKYNFSDLEVAVQSLTKEVAEVKLLLTLVDGKLNQLLNSRNEFVSGDQVDEVKLMFPLTSIDDIERTEREL